MSLGKRGPMRQEKGVMRAEGDGVRGSQRLERVKEGQRSWGVG